MRRYYRRVSALVADPAEIAAIAEQIQDATLVAFDLEFLSQDRLVPALCLVQVAWLPAHVRLDVPATVIVATPPEVALLDPLAVDVGPVIQAIASHPCAVVHAGRQDLALLATRFGVAMPAIADTQVMAAFAGIGDQVGLATLANELLGTSLGKDLQWTDWSKRPLTQPQMEYADSDVRHLPAIYALLAARLAERLAWARAESSEVAAVAVAATQVTPETAWKNVGGLRGLDPAAMAAVMSLAAWRQETAVALDRPLGQVLNDRTLVELARSRPSTTDAVRATKNLSPVARQRAAEICEAIAQASPSDAPAPSTWRTPSARAQRWSDLLLAIVQHESEMTGVAARLLATRADVEELARVVDEQGLEAAYALPAFSTWRRDVIGKLFAGWFEGTLVLAGDVTAPSGMRIVRYDQPTQK